MPPKPHVRGGLVEACRYAAPMAGLMPKFMTVAFSFAPPGAAERPAFLMCWAYRRKVSIARCDLNRLDAGSSLLVLGSPVRIERLADALVGLVPDGGVPLTMWRGRIKWLTLRVAEYGDEEAISVKPAKKTKPKGDCAPPDPAEGEENDDDWDDGDEGGAADDFLEAYLEELIDKGLEYHGDQEEEKLAEHPEDQELDPDGQEPDGEPWDSRGGDGEPGGDGPDGGGAHSAPGTPIISEIPLAVSVEVDRQKKRLEDAVARARRSDGAPLSKGTVSLAIKPDGHPVLIVWTNPAARVGRPMRIDEWGRIIALAAWLQPETNYNDAAITVVDTGMVQNRASRRERDYAEDWVLLLRLQANTRLHSGPLAPLARERCVICEHNEAAHPSAVVPPDDPAPLHYRCQSCLLLWHDCCARRYSSTNDFDSFVCPVCA